MDTIKWNRQGLVPAVVQDSETKEVLMLADMNEEALNLSMQTGKAHYYSRSRGRIWMKGESSGNVQLVRDIKVDCDGDTLLLLVEQQGPACHTGNKSCFFTAVSEQGENRNPDNEKANADIYRQQIGPMLEEVYAVIADRKAHPREGSYTNYLLEEGLDKILKKVGEETAEVIIAAKNPDEKELIYETADLLYHLLVLLFERGVTLPRVSMELANRR
jgi:phosphoribosyl-ATP pyrophosphohydrolase/phosphoribosyl-AMP cyclohydrolase